MTKNDIITQLENRKSIPENAFEILRAISKLYNSGEEDLSRELVLRALEQREAFGAYQTILDSLTRELGLFPYIESNTLPLMDAIAYEYHRPANLDGSIVFHREQAEVYRRLIAGDNVILSAPTSFGKSKIIDAIIASGNYRNLVIIVPTIALIDETRRRLIAFSNEFKIITQVSQEPSDKNLFVFTAERAIAYENFPKIDFFVIDEFYKIGALNEDPKRTAALNQAFYKFSKAGAQFYLLGPCVKQIPDGFEERFRCHFFPTNFSTVVSEVFRIYPEQDDIKALCELIKSLKNEQTLIYCKSPKRVNEVANALLESEVTSSTRELDLASDWASKNFHPEWVFPKALKRRIGIHHGKLPRSLSQFVVRAFNNEQIQVLVCTSTLIEGVNTKAKNIVIFDNTIAKQKKLDFFTFNNIKGRAGRMFQHFIGKIFLFHEAPNEKLPIIDFPLYTQGKNTPESILVQIDQDDLTPISRERVEPYRKQKEIPWEFFQQHSSIEPKDLLSLAKRLRSSGPIERAMLAWTGFPKYENLKAVCELAWSELIHRGQAGVFTGSQLAHKIWKLSQTSEIRKRILDELEPGDYAAESPDEAVERVLDFDRTWASFEFPRILRAFSAIRQHVHGGYGDYTYYAGKLENLFRPPFQVTLEEFGFPLQITDKISPALKGLEKIDSILARIKKLDISKFGLNSFEKEIFLDSQAAV